MSNWKLNKWMEDMTPRRAIQNFFDHATPVDSPDPEELVQPHEDAVEGTPLASQSSQPAVALKRKILEGSLEDNPAKRLAQQESGDNSSILGLSELPSKLGSPSIESLARPKVGTKKRVSTSTFSQVIQSQESQTVKVDETKLVEDDSFPSNLGSPDAVVSQRPGKKTRMSTSAFSRTIEAGRVVEKSVTRSSNVAADLSEESTELPQSLESPVIKYRPGPKSSKKRTSSIGFQDTVHDRTSNASKSAQPTPSVLASLNTTAVPDTLESPANIPTDIRLLNKPRKRISITAFSQVIEKHANNERVEPVRTSKNRSSASPTPNKQTSDQVVSEDSSPAIKEIESPLELSSSLDPSIHITEFQSQQLPGKMAEKSVSKKRTPTPDDVEQYLSFSDDDVDNAPISKEKVVEFTAHQAQQPPVQEKGLSNESEAKESLSSKPIPKITVTEDDPEISDDDEFKFTDDTNIIFKRTYAHPKDKTATAEASDDEELKFTDDASITFKRTYAHPKGKTATAETTDNFGIPDIGSPEDFAPTVSSTQLIKRKPPTSADQTLLEELLSDNQRAIAKKNLSLTPAKTNQPERDDDLSESDIPSKLNSPEEVKRDRQRPGPASSKKRVSMTQFMAALDQKNVMPPRFETPRRSSALPTSPVLAPEEVPPPLVATPMKESLEVSKVLSRRTSRSSTSSSTTVPRLEPVSASENDSNLTSDDEKAESPRVSKTPIKRISTAPTASSSTAPQQDIEPDNGPSYVAGNNESGTEPNSPSDLILLPAESNKTSQTLISVARSRKSLIFDSIDTTPDVTPSEESQTSISLRLSSPNERKAPADRSPIKSSPDQEAVKTSEAVTLEGRSRKSLRFDSAVLTRDITPAEETIPSDSSRQTRSNEEIVDATPSTENVEQDVEQDVELPEIPEEVSVRRGSTEDERFSTSSRKSEKTALSPFNRYPGLKNSTVVAGGAPFMDVSPLSMSPIVARDKDSLPSAPATPSAPTTPAQPTKKPSRSIAHSPMFLSVMQKAYKNQESRKTSSAAPLPQTERTPVTSKQAEKSLRKGTSLSNTLKGKSIALSMVSEDHESSESEDDEPNENNSVKPIPIKVAFELQRQNLPDRSKNYVPLEKRLKENTAFQAKVNVQKAKNEAAKIAEQAAAIKKKATTRKPRIVKKMADNLANVVTNKGNLRFFAKFKVAKDGLEVAHDLMSEWLDFTLDQMETFCDEEGTALDSWEHCYKMLKRQNDVKNVAEYAGRCHEVLLNDEAQDLLPFEFPPGHYERKRQAKRRRML